MIVRIADLDAEVRNLEFSESPEAVNEAIAASSRGAQERLQGELKVQAEIYCVGTDIHFGGMVRGSVQATCARCLDDFVMELERPFQLVLMDEGDPDSSPEDAGCDSYSGDDLDLGPVVCEQALLGLLAVPLCSTECRGLCGGCGANRNHEDCRCPA